MIKNEKQNVRRILIPESNMVYHFNGVVYLVKSKFHEGNGYSMKSCFGRILENNFLAHLTHDNDDDKIKVEYVLDTAGKEDYADQNETK